MCIGGLGLLVVSDTLTDRNYPALNKGKGDAFMIVGATLYGFSEFCSPCPVICCRMPSFAANATEEFLVRRRPLYEVGLTIARAVRSSLTFRSQVVGQLGMWGTLINGIQASALEHYDMTQASWNGATSKLRTVYCVVVHCLEVDLSRVLGCVYRR